MSEDRGVSSEALISTRTLGCPVAGRDLGWRKFSLLVCRFLGGNVNPLRSSPGFNILRSFTVAVTRARVDVSTNRIVPTVEAVTRQNDAGPVA